MLLSGQSCKQQQAQSDAAATEVLPPHTQLNVSLGRVGVAGVYIFEAGPAGWTGIEDCLCPR
jgi:hypothetical protein